MLNDGQIIQLIEWVLGLAPVSMGKFRPGWRIVIWMNIPSIKVCTLGEKVAFSLDASTDERDMDSVLRFSKGLFLGHAVFQTN